VKRHPFDPFSFFFGVVFAVVALGFLTDRIDLTDSGLMSIWPIPAIGLGLLLLIVATRREPMESAPSRDQDHPGQDRIQE
jgi:hypothetical protein